MPQSTIEISSALPQGPRAEPAEREKVCVAQTLLSVPDHPSEVHKITDKSVCTTKNQIRTYSERILVKIFFEISGWLPRNSSGADPSPAREQFNQGSRVVLRGFRVLSSEGKRLSLSCWSSRG